MKKQIAIASAILAASSYSFAEIALTESLSVEGFVDMSYTDRDGTGINHDPDNPKTRSKKQLTVLLALIKLSSTSNSMPVVQLPHRLILSMKVAPPTVLVLNKLSSLMTLAMIQRLLSVVSTPSLVSKHSSPLAYTNSRTLFRLATFPVKTTV
jgi:hypothetical protein